MIEMELIELNNENIDQAYDGWFYTILGCGGDPKEWMHEYQKLLDYEKIGQVHQWYKTTGKVLNDKWDLTGNERFKDDLSILMFDYKGMNIGKLAIFKLKMCDRWFTDIIDNSVRICHPAGRE